MAKIQYSSGFWKRAEGCIYWMAAHSVERGAQTVGVNASSVIKYRKLLRPFNKLEELLENKVRKSEAGR